MTIMQTLFYYPEDSPPSHTKDYNIAKALDCGFETLALPLFYSPD